MLRLPVAGLLAVSLLLPIADARAGTVVLEGEVIVFKGTGDEKNSVRLSGIDHPDHGPMISIYDGDAAITAVDLDYCLPVEGSSTACVYGSSGLRLELGGGDDWARIDRAFDTNGKTVAMPLTMLGGAGNDTLADENDVTAARRFEGGPGNDTISAEDGTDVVLGEDGNDVIDGGAGDDEVRGGAGDDTVRGDRFAAPGSDVVDGGPGVDTGDEWSIPSESNNPPVVITQDGAGGDGRPGENDNVTSIERFSSGVFGTIEGTAGADSIVTWGNGDSVIRGLDGDDRIETGSKKEEIDGGAGADSIVAGSGDDRITGGPGADTILADGGTIYCGYYTCQAPFGNDHVFVRDGEVDSVDCGVGQDVVEADANDVVASNCEDVRRSGGGGGAGAAGGGGAGDTGGGSAPGSVAAPTLKLLTGLRFEVTCPGACAVHARLFHKRKLIGTASRTGSGVARIKLSRAGKRRLRGLRRAKLSLRVTVGTTAFRRTVSYRR